MMETDSICMFQAEIGDQILFSDGVVVIHDINENSDDDGDFYNVIFKDEDGENVYEIMYPFDTLTVITKFDDDIEIEDIS